MKTIFMAAVAVSAWLIVPPVSASPRSGEGAGIADLRAEIEAGVSSGEIERYEANPLRKGLRKLVALENRLGADGFTDNGSAKLRKRTARLRQQINEAEHTDVRRDRKAKADDRRAARAATNERKSAAAEDREARRVAAEERRSRKAAADVRREDASDEKHARRTATEERRERAARAVLLARFDGKTPADRFEGDVRIGQGPSARMVAVPEALRRDFADTDAFYYRYDDKRIYRLDRDTNLIVGLLDT
jgi:flagellar biosynthesis GTPase FlhF